MADMVVSTLAQVGVSVVSSYISTKLDERASRAHLVARLEEALYRLEYALERTGKMPITDVLLLQRRKMFKDAYMEGADLLSKHKQQVREGHGEIGQLVTSPSYLERIIALAQNLPIPFLARLNKQWLSSYAVKIFEWSADRAEKFVADVDSGCCPLRHDNFFRYPFVRQLLEGKTLRYIKMEGSQRIYFRIWPVILEGRGIEADLFYEYFDPERLDKSFWVSLRLRLSESTDIVGMVINCIQASAPLLNAVAQDAVGELALLHNLQDISYFYAPPWAGIQESHTKFTHIFRSDPVCCQAKTFGNDSISSEFSHIIPEQTILFLFKCYIPALDYSLASASDEASRTVMRNWSPLEMGIGFAPHSCFLGDTESFCIISDVMGSNNKKEERPYGSVQQTIGTVRLEAMNCLIRQPEVTQRRVHWVSKHGSAHFRVEKPCTNMATMPKTRVRYNTRSATKRKR